MLEKDLQKIGLSEKEAKVYLATLELGESPVQKIANKAKVNRATTYVVLESLMALGVIAMHEEGSKRQFVATGPYALKNVLRKREEEIAKKKEKLQNLFPALNKVYNTLPNRAVIRYYEGKEALQSLREQFLQVKNKHLYTFFSADEVENIFTKEDRHQYTERRKEKDIHTSSIYNPREDGVLRPAKDNHSDRTAIAKKDAYFPCDITVFDDNVAISILRGSPSGIVIESASIADTFRSIFALAKEGVEDSDT